MQEEVRLTNPFAQYSITRFLTIVSDKSAEPLKKVELKKSTMAGPSSSEQNESSALISALKQTFNNVEGISLKVATNVTRLNLLLAFRFETAT